MTTHEFSPGSVQRLLDIMRQLRSPEGCPWDRKQTTQSLVPYAIEETAEFMEAAEDGNIAGMREELGDMLMHIVLHSVIAEERGWFSLEDVAQGVCEKMVRRHPHVFGDAPKISTAEEVPGAWAQIKQKEKPNEFKSLLGKYPRHYPALLRAQKIVDKAATVGYDWKDAAGVREKLREEWAEWNEALDSGDSDHIDEEFGDVLFVMVCLARHTAHLPAEVLLRKACEKFERRFHHIERTLLAQGRDLATTPIETMESLWQDAKRIERESASHD